MRVIAGSAKGKKLHPPKGMNIRPTSDRVKEAIFNILGQRVAGAEVLDLFAGTGNLGIEALSRGAIKAYFVDTSVESIKLTRKNLEITGLVEKSVTLKSDVERAIKRFIKEGLKFDLIFLDPPYRISVSSLDAILFTLASYILSSDGLLILEHSIKLEPRIVEELVVESTRTYGDTAVTFYRARG